MIGSGFMNKEFFVTNQNIITIQDPKCQAQGLAFLTLDVGSTNKCVNIKF